MDLFGGTMSMGLACLTTGRSFTSSEIIDDVYHCAYTRLCKYIAMRLRSNGRTAGTKNIVLNGRDASTTDARTITLLASRDLHTLDLVMYPPLIDPAQTLDDVQNAHGNTLEIKRVPTTEATGKGNRALGKGLS